MKDTGSIYQKIVSTPILEERFDIIKEVQIEAYNQALEDAVGSVKLLFHDGHFKENKEIDHFQSGENNIQISKQSILKLKK